MKKRCLVVSLVGALVVAALSASGLIAQVKTSNRRQFGSALAKAHPKEAQAVLAAVKGLWSANNRRGLFEERFLSDAEELYRWSRRLLDAERSLADSQQKDIAALLDHWRRMDRIFNLTKKLFDTGSKGGEPERVAAAKFYRAEAELWIVAGGGTIPKSEPLPDSN